jgi:hypothetical protein
MYEYKVVRLNRKNRGKIKGFTPGNRYDSIFTNFLNNESVDNWEFYCFRGLGGQAVFRRKIK